jgi:hypothetical protein
MRISPGGVLSGQRFMVEKGIFFAEAEGAPDQP